MIVFGEAGSKLGRKAARSSDFSSPTGSSLRRRRAMGVESTPSFFSISGVNAYFPRLFERVWMLPLHAPSCPSL